jgi:hypothetical protein
MIESGVIRAAKSSVRQLDMRLELVDVEALNFGRDQAMVVQDAIDKRRIRGFFNIVAVYLVSNQLMRGSHNYSGSTLSGFGRRVGGRALADLADACNEFTDIKVRLVDDIAASDKRLLKIPWAVMAPSNRADLLPPEAENIGKYLTGGGFLMVEGGSSSEPRCRNLFVKSLETAGLRRGKHWEFEILPDDHPIYRSFFNFDGAPWGGDVFTAREVGYAGEDRWYRVPLERRDYIEGITLDGRLVAIYEVKGYVGAWQRTWFFVNITSAGTKRNNIDIQKLGINIIVFALTQEGSIARRTVASSD